MTLERKVNVLFALQAASILIFTVAIVTFKKPPQPYTIRAEQGQPGTNGRIGNPGLNGKDGKDGISIIGPKGTAGLDGKSTLQILKGEDAVGVAGPKGEPGPPGPQGPQGADGQQGPSGDRAEFRTNPQTGNVEYKYPSDDEWSIIIPKCEYQNCE